MCLLVLVQADGYVNGWSLFAGWLEQHSAGTVTKFPIGADGVYWRQLVTDEVSVRGPKVLG